ncbi:hypothetical protein E8E13_011373 [Curvularia kusanoi]|uniref:N-acetyltransferase domain-containing protein n=1 Tax=Curvularia kusanoi TaxID=90978 RepID=A0A9P4WEH3_CURKU|nr:hypothetical protein E8E13_011373 [Curvularia kusanoi]
MATNQYDIIIAPVQTEQDIKQANYCVSEAFGRQTKDSIWILMNSGWDTEEGQASLAEGMIKRWKNQTYNKDGVPNKVYLKATVPDPENPGQRRVAGMAIWQQFSEVDGLGDKFTGDMTEALAKLDETNKRFADQMFKSLWKRRTSYLKEIAQQKDRTSPPAIFTLDLCAVDPAFQRRGIAAKLVQWGLEEAKKRGNLECTTEGSAMGRGVYRKLGFKDEGEGDIVFEVDDEFADWSKPPNVFLRTGV